MPKPGPDRDASDEEILRVLVLAYEPALGTSDVANAFGVTRRAAGNWLDDLYERGLVEKGTAGPATIWWVSDRGRRQLSEATSSDSSSS